MSSCIPLRDVFHTDTYITSLMDAILTTGGGSNAIQILKQDPPDPPDGELWIIYDGS